jgi:hypothetical protein
MFEIGQPEVRVPGGDQEWAGVRQHVVQLLTIVAVDADGHRVAPGQQRHLRNIQINPAGTFDHAQVALLNGGRGVAVEPCSAVHKDDDACAEFQDGRQVV